MTDAVSGTTVTVCDDNKCRSSYELIRKDVCVGGYSPLALFQVGSPSSCVEFDTTFTLLTACADGCTKCTFDRENLRCSKCSSAFVGLIKSNVNGEWRMINELDEKWELCAGQNLDQLDEYSLWSLFFIICHPSSLPQSM